MLPPSIGGREEPRFLILREEVHQYLPAAAGDEVRVTVEVDSAHPIKKKRDSVGIVVVDPSGQVVRREKFGFADLAEDAAEDALWHGRRVATFRAELAGVYDVMLNGVRYAYGLGASSHGWLTALRAPLHLFLPRELVFKMQRGAETVKLLFGTKVPVEVRNAAGHTLPATVKEGAGLNRLVIEMLDAEPRVIVVTMPESPKTLKLKAVSGVQPWLAASPDAPFPAD